MRKESQREKLRIWISCNAKTVQENFAVPVDPNSSPKDRLIAIGAILFLVVSFIIIAIVARLTGTPPAAH